MTAFRARWWTHGSVILLGYRATRADAHGCRKGTNEDNCVDSIGSTCTACTA